MNIPTESDWQSEPWGIDTPYAYEHYFGIDIDTACNLIGENGDFYIEDILYMPLLCFRYYIFAFTKYLLSDMSNKDSGAASYFFGIIECRLEDIRASSPHLIEEVINTLERLRDNQEWYDADIDIYGDFSETAGTLIEKIYD